MMIGVLQVAVTVTLLVCSVNSKGYGGSGGVSNPSIPGGAQGPFSGKVSPKPYSFSYQEADEEGGLQYKSESGDGSGNIQGNYGYYDAQGLFREVQYTANQQGYKATVKTNEPGVGKESPADVTMIVEQTPAGIQEKYTPSVHDNKKSASWKPTFESMQPAAPTSRLHSAELESGFPGKSAYSGYNGASGEVSGIAQTSIAGRSVGGAARRSVMPSGGGAGTGLFAGIKKSTSGKSTY